MHKDFTCELIFCTINKLFHAICYTVLVSETENANGKHMQELVAFAAHIFAITGIFNSLKSTAKNMDPFNVFVDL